MNIVICNSNKTIDWYLLFIVKQLYAVKQLVACLQRCIIYFVVDEGGINTELLLSRQVRLEMPWRRMAMTIGVTTAGPLRGKMSINVNLHLPPSRVLDAGA